MWRLLAGLVALPALLVGCGWLFSPAGTFTGWAVVNLLVYPPIVVTSIVLHEGGHALVARLLGLRVLRIEIGLGRRIARWRERSIKPVAATSRGGDRASPSPSSESPNPVESMPQPPSPPPQLSRVMLATLVFTVILGLPVDKAGGIAGQLAVGVWTWAVFLVLLKRINQQLRVPLMLCLVISTLAECCLSLVWGLYVYWLQNVPFFVPPGHVLLFTLGLTFAPHLPRWFLVLVAAFAAGYGTTAFLTSADTFSTPLAMLFLIFMAFGRHRRLYATMFVISLLMELYGTWIGNWVWVPEVPGLPLSSANPPLCVGGLYCVLDLLVVNADRAWRRWRRSPATPAGARDHRAVIPAAPSTSDPTVGTGQ